MQSFNFFSGLSTVFSTHNFFHPPLTRVVFCHNYFRKLIYTHCKTHSKHKNISPNSDPKVDFSSPVTSFLHILPEMVLG